MEELAVKKHKTEKPTSPNSDKSYQESLENVVLAALLLIMLIPAFIGIYFRNDFFIMHLTTSIPLLIVLLIYNKNKLNILSGPLDYILGGLTLLFIISIVWSVWPHMALEEAYRYINYFMVYWLVAKLMKRAQLPTAVNFLFALGVLMSLLGLFDYLGVMNIDAERGGRITGTLRYTNAFAAYMGATYILGLYLAVSKDSFAWLYNLGGFIMLTAFMGTLSRAMWLVFLPFFIFYLIGFKGNKKENAINAAFVSILGIGAAFLVFSEAVLPIKALALIIGAVLSTLSAQAVVYLRKVKIKSVHFLLGTAALLIALGFAAFQYILTNQILDRLLRINFQESSVVARFAFYQDAWRIIMDSPLLGYSGGAWEALYVLYRSYLYFTKEVHSHVLEIGIALGIPGMLLFLAAIIYIVVIMFRTKESVVWALCLASLMLFSHSMLDLDFSIGFLSLVTWIMMGIVANYTGDSIFKEIKIKKLFAIIFIFLYVTSSASFLISTKYSNLNEKEDYEDAHSKISKAITFYPLYSKNYGTLANINFLAYQATKKEAYLDEALLEIDKAIQWDKLNYVWYAYKASYLTEKGKLGEALALLIDKKEYLFKYDNDAYDRVSGYIAAIAEKYHQQGDIASAQEAHGEITLLWEEAEEQMAKVSPHHLKMWVQEDTLTTYDPFILKVIKAYDYLGDNNQAQELLKKLSPETIKENEWLNNL
jgi:O-antigen ligase